MKKHYDIVQIGAHNGYTWNDKYITDELKPEHSAIFVEPIKELFDVMVVNHNKFRPNNNYIFLNKACSNYNGTLDLYIPNIELFSRETESKYIQLGVPVWTDQLVSALPDHVKGHRINLDTKVVNVECVTLDKIVEEYEIGSIDILHVDTEGHDYEVLMGLNFNNIKPKIIVFEHKHIDGTNSPLGDRYNQIMKHLFDFGYDKTDMDTEDTHLKLR